MDQRNETFDSEEPKASFSSSFEVYAAIGGDPDNDEVDDLFVAASKAVLNIEDENTRTRTRSPGRIMRRTSSNETQTQITTEVHVIDCEKLDVYFSSEDNIHCFSILISINVTSSYGDMSKVSTTAENLAEAAELAFTNGEFGEALKTVEAPISVLLMEMAPESSSGHADDDDEDVDYYPLPESLEIDADDDNDDDNNDENDNDDENDRDDENHLSPKSSAIDVDNDDVDYGYEYDDDSSDDSSALSMDPGDFDNFLEISYREYLQDQNRQTRRSSLELIRMQSPSRSVSEFPSEYIRTATMYTKDRKVKTRTGQKVKFSPVVRVKNTLSRFDMTPTETCNYWNGEDEYMTDKSRERMLKVLTDKWTQKKEQESNEQIEGDFEDDISPSLLIPILPSINELLPLTERENHDGYTYTVSIRG